MSARLVHLNLNREVEIIAHTDAIELTSLQAEQLVPRPKTKGQPSSSSRSAPASSSASRATGLPILDSLTLRFTILRRVAVIQILFRSLEGQLVLQCLLVVLFLGQQLHIFGTTSAISERLLATSFIYFVSARSLLLITVRFCTLTEGWIQRS